MRPRLIALIAVSAFALVGCASSELTSAQDSAPVGNHSEATPQSDESALEGYEDPTKTTEYIEGQFADFAELRAEVHGAKKPERTKVISELHANCDSGSSIKVSSTKALNENLEKIADSTYCEKLAAQ